MRNSVCAMREEGRSAGIRRWALWIPILALSLTGALAEAITLTAVQSRKTHGAAGTFDLAIDLTQNIDGTVTVESLAIGAGHKMVFQFDQPVIA